MFVIKRDGSKQKFDSDKIKKAIQGAWEDILPKDLVRHFVRGFVDGDGWVGIGTQSRGARFSRFNITCASIDFLNDLVDTMGWEHRAIHSKQNSKAV